MNRGRYRSIGGKSGCHGGATDAVEVVNGGPFRRKSEIQKNCS